MVAKLIAASIRRFGDAIGEGDQQISRLQHGCLMIVRNPRKQADRKSFARQSQNLSLPDDDRGKVSGIRVDQLSVLIRVQTQEKRCVLLRRAADVEMIIQYRENAGR